MNLGKAFKVPAFRILAGDLGLRVEDVLKRAGLSQVLFDQPEVWLTTDEYFRLWEAMQAVSGDDALPIRVVEAVTAEGFEPLLFATLCSPDLCVALHRLATYKRLLAPISLKIERDEHSVRARFRWLDANTNVPVALVAMEAAFVVRIARMATREHIRPTAVVSPILPPRPDVYEQYFGTPIQKGDEVQVAFTIADAQRPFLTVNESMWQLFEPELRKRLSQIEESASLVDKVRAVLLECLPSGRSAIGDVAAELTMSSRTLQRRLQGEGTSYQAILSRTREQLARNYLNNTSLSCTEIAFLLGYEEPNSFTRAFQDWTGQSPEAVRPKVSN